MSLSQLQSDAYRAVLRAVATTQMDWSKEKLLTDLRKELQITTQEHFEVLTAVMQDNEIEALRENRVLEPQPVTADAGLLKRKKDVMGARVDYTKKTHKKPRHLELTESPLDTPAGTPLPTYTPLDASQQQQRGPGRPSMRPFAYDPAAAGPASGGYEAKRPPGRPPGSGPGLAEPKRGPGRPPVRLTSQPSLTGRLSKRKSAISTSAAGIAGATAYGTNELVGRKIWRYWPEEAKAWSEGIITDYRDWSDEHCIVYNINTPEESYEWFRIRDAKTPEEYRLVDGYAEDMKELVSGYQAKVANQGAARQRHGGRSGKRGGKSAGRGRPASAHVKTQPLLTAGGAAEPAAAAAAAASPGRPFGRRELAEKLRSSGAAELQASL
ncbi:g7839 [Coccomyxa elongata]